MKNQRRVSFVAFQEECLFDSSFVLIKFIFSFVKPNESINLWTRERRDSSFKMVLEIGMRS